MTITLTAPIPRTQLLSANGRLHWGERSRRTSYVRNLFASEWAHLRARGTAPLEYAYLSAIWTFPSNRRRDLENLAPTLKAAIDGVVSGPTGFPRWKGILPDDSHEYLVGPDPRVTDPDPRLTGHVRLTLRFEPIEEGPC